MSIQVTYASQASIQDSPGGGFIDPNDATITINQMNVSATLTASTTPPVTKYSAFSVALSSGTGSIDLTSLPDNNGVAAAVTFSGLKPQVVKLRNKSTNANSIKVAVGASNGYDGFGSDFAVTLQPGDELLWKGNDNSGVTDVASGKRTFDLTGTGSQVLEVELIAG